MDREPDKREESTPWTTSTELKLSSLVTNSSKFFITSEQKLGIVALSELWLEEIDEETEDNDESKM